MAIYNGNNGNNIIRGSDESNDRLYGHGGDDKLYGLGGSDLLVGGIGDDYLQGDFEAFIDPFGFENGNDTYVFAKHDGQDTLVETGGVDVVRFVDVASTDVKRLVEVNEGDLRLVYGNGDSITITGYFLFGYHSLGWPFMNQGDYWQRIEYFRFSDGVTWRWADIKAKVPLPVATTGNDFLFGYNEKNNQLNGLAGNDKLKGFEGNDTLNGGTGNDELDGGNGNDTYLFAKSDGKDVINEYWGDDTVIFTDVASTEITKVSRAGYHGDDLRLDYGTENRLTVSYYFNSYLGVYVVEKFQFSDGVVWDEAKIIQLVAQVTAGDDVLYGDYYSNTLNGLAGNDALYGLEGDDILFGGPGDDTLEGGYGNDTLDGGAGVDWAQYSEAFPGVIVNLGLATAQNTGAAGMDTLTGIENLSGSPSNDTLIGSVFANVLVGGSGDDKLFGNSGGDTLKGGDGNDSLLGDAGNDTLDGGKGVDWGQYWNAAAGVTVKLNIDHVQDTVAAGMDSLTGIENLNGSQFNDTLVGNQYANTLFGGSGNDVLNGRYGNDKLFGGPGRDSFLFDTVPSSGNKDTIFDFIVADDTINLDNSIFKTLTTGKLDVQAFKIVANTATVDADDRIIYRPTTGELYYDADGNGPEAQLPIALLGAGISGLTAANFVVV